MIRMMDKGDAVASRRYERGPARQFAYDTLVEFLRVAGPGDVAEVTEAPELSADPVKNADKVLNAVRAELFYMGKRGEVVAFRRRERMFLERKGEGR